MPNPFEIFSLPVRFTLDPGELHRRYITAASACHPDRFVDDIEQAEAADRSAELNHAYRTLHDPMTRAQAMISILGAPGQGDDKSLPPDLLIEVLEAREEMERATAENDRATLDRLAEWARQRKVAHLGRIAGLLDRAVEQASPERDGTLKQAKLELNALRYFQRMLEQAP